MLEELGWVDGGVDPRPLRRLGVVAGSVLLAGVVLLVHEHHRGGRGLSGGALLVVWLVVALAALLLLGAVGGLLARRTAVRRPRLSLDELRTQQLARSLLRRGGDVPPELREAARRVVDDTYAKRWSLLLWVVLGAYWTGTAFVYEGRELWIHLGLGLGYLGLAVWPLLDRRRVLRGGARLGIRPNRRQARARRGRARR